MFPLSAFLAHSLAFFSDPLQPVPLPKGRPPRCLVVRRPPRERKIPGSNPACDGIFSGSSHTSDSKIGTPVATLPGAWRYRVSAGTGRTGVSILWLGEVESLICNSYLSVAARKLSEQIRPWDTLACCWDVKQPTNKPKGRMWSPVQCLNGHIQHLPQKTNKKPPKPKKNPKNKQTKNITTNKTKREPTKLALIRDHQSSSWWFRFIYLNISIGSALQ